MQVSLDQFGRIVIPKKVREHFALASGAQLLIEESGDSIILKPHCDEPTLVDKEGVLVFTGKSLEDVEDTLERHRKKRINQLGDLK